MLSFIDTIVLCSMSPETPREPNQKSFLRELAAAYRGGLSEMKSQGLKEFAGEIGIMLLGDDFTMFRNQLRKQILRAAREAIQDDNAMSVAFSTGRFGKHES